MKRARLGIIAAAILAVAPLAFAQTPDFSGTWTLDAEATGTTGGRGRGMGGPMTVRQTADTLTIERTRGENKTVTTYKLDGTESVNTQTMGRRGGTTEVKSVAGWDGPRLTITTSRQMGGQTVESTETWSMDGANLAIERTGGRGASKLVYTKAK